MSAWRLVVRELYEHGGRAPASRLSGDIDRHALAQAISRGMVAGPGKGNHRGAGDYALTPAGEALAQNRVAMVPRCASVGHQHRAPGSDLVPRPTWLASLPDDIRLTDRSPA